VLPKPKIHGVWALLNFFSLNNYWQFGLDLGKILKNYLIIHRGFGGTRQPGRDLKKKEAISPINCPI
jgi:hypothetical protein